MKSLNSLFKGQHKKLLYQLFYSYIIFLIIPVFLLSTLAYFSIINYSKEKITNANLMKLQIVQNNIDIYFNEVKNCALEIANDRRTDSIYSIKKWESPYSFDSVSKVLDMLELFKKTRGLKNYIHSMYLFNQDEQIIISSKGGLHKKEEFFDTSWINLLKDKNAFGIYTTDVRMPINHEMLNNKVEAEKLVGKLTDVLTFIFPLNYIKFKGAIAINVEYDMLFRDIILPEDSGETYFVVDHQGKMIFNGLERDKKTGINTSALVENVIYNNSNHGYFTYFSDNQEYMVMFRKSSINDLVIINMVRVGLLFDRIFFFRALIILLSISILIVGIIMSIIMSRRIYSPISKTLEELKSRIMIDPKYKKNELNTIFDAVNELVNKGKESDQLISINKTKLMEAHIIGLAMGKINEESMEPDFIEDYSACFIISIDRYKEFSRKYTFKDQHNYKSLILRVSNQIVNMYAKGLGAVLEMDKIVVIVSMKENQLEQFQSVAKSIYDKLQAEIPVVKDFSISIAVGGIHAGSENIRRSFMEAEKALKYRLFYGYGCFVHYDEIKFRNETCNYLQDKESHIINYLKMNSYNEIKDIITEFTEDVKENGKGVNYESVVQTVIQLVSRTMEHLALLHINANDILKENYNVYMEIIGIETLDDMCEWLLSLYNRILSYQLYHTQCIDNKKHIGKVIEIIENNYMWGDLSIEWVSDQLNLSYSHLRKIFREEVGTNFINYLNRIRIEHAKELLVNTGLTVIEIAIKSGYNNDQCLTRFFKKYEGITPGKYRTNWLELKQSIQDDQ